MTAPRAIAAGAFALFSCAAATMRASASDIAIGPGAIVGSIRDRNDHPVAGARVIATGPISREALTSAAGIVTLQALPLGYYSLRVSRVGFAPVATHVRLANARGAPTLVRLRVMPTTFANLTSAASVVDTVPLDTALDATVDRAIERAPTAAIVATGGTFAAAPTLLGSAPGETRMELDGIPLAGDDAAAASLRFRTALSLATIDLARGPLLGSPTVRDAIGGVIDYRTPDIDTIAQIAANAGYSSTFGAFEHVRANEPFGKLGVLADIVAGGGDSRSQTLKASYAFAPSLSLGIAAYDSQGRATIEGRDVSASAPAFAADLHATLGTGTLEARAFASRSQIDTSQTTFARRAVRANETSAEARTNGTQLRYAWPVGDARFSLGYDRRSDDAAGILRVYTTVAARANLALAPFVRLEVADLYGRGTSLEPRNDPQISLAFAAAPRTTLQLSAGSAYATAPDAFVRSANAKPAAAALERPETAFGYRVGFEEALASGDRAWVTLDTSRRFRRFERIDARSDGRVSALELGYERAIEPGHVGGGAYLRVQRGIAADRGAPSTKARATLDYADTNESFEFGATYLGADSGLASRAVALGDLRTRFSLGRAFALGIGVDNIFGTIVTNPALAPFYTPREITLTFGRYEGP